MSGGGFGLCRVTTSCQVSSRCLLAETLPKLYLLYSPHAFSWTGWELSCVTHIGAGCSVPAESVQHHWKRQHCEGLHQLCGAHHFTIHFFPGLRGGRGDAYTVLESSWELRQEAGGPGGDGAHRGIGPSSPGPILSTWWLFWSWGWMNKSEWIGSEISGTILLTSNGWPDQLIYADWCLSAVIGPQLLRQH